MRGARGECLRGSQICIVPEPVQTCPLPTACCSRILLPGREVTRESPHGWKGAGEEAIGGREPDTLRLTIEADLPF
jgi:hypothetical protein